jgi:heme-degrading monooxygenase HmoA
LKGHLEEWKVGRLEEFTNLPTFPCQIALKGRWKLSLIHIIWEFRIKPEKQAEFEHYYASTGPWANLFRKSEAYRGTTLVRDIERPERYLVTDVWADLAAFQNFKASYQDDYDELDKLGEQFTEEEHYLGLFVAV